VAYVGEPLEFGRSVQAEAWRRGLGQAPRVFMVAAGGVLDFITPVSSSGTWRTPCIPKMRPARGRGYNRSCTRCGTVAKLV